MAHLTSYRQLLVHRQVHNKRLSIHQSEHLHSLFSHPLPARRPSVHRRDSAQAWLVACARPVRWPGIATLYPVKEERDIPSNAKLNNHAHVHSWVGMGHRLVFDGLAADLSSRIPWIRN